MLDQLGGVIKIAKIEDESNQNDLLNKLFIQLSSHHKGSKLNFGLSIHNWSERNLRILLIGLRKEFQKNKLSSRFANQNFKNISTAQHKGLSKKGVEYLVLREGDIFYIAQVIAVQDIDFYSHRDYDKPFRDMQVGMLPPKLAQVMINLAEVDEGVLWDPFCGGGVLLMEAMLMGYDVIGSDISEKTLEGAKENVDWIKKEYGISSNIELFVHDATKPYDGLKSDMIVTEGYLGPPQTEPLNTKEAENSVDHLGHLYLSFFENLKKMNYKNPIVIILPFFKCQNGKIEDMRQVIKKIESLGFSQKITPIYYSRLDQFVGRQVCRFILD